MGAACSLHGRHLLRANAPVSRPCVQYARPPAACKTARVVRPVIPPWCRVRQALCSGPKLRQERLPHCEPPSGLLPHGCRRRRCCCHHPQALPRPPGLVDGSPEHRAGRRASGAGPPGVMWLPLAQRWHMRQRRRGMPRAPLLAAASSRRLPPSSAVHSLCHRQAPSRGRRQARSAPGKRAPPVAF